ncbi:hypothetical protein L5515_017326 [Caenorhabditis briggsae]|uniref:Uncharacterized protein n=1 Tax=Caenorhabditis briggsae TaxID=6238 RepID=A0AAE9JPY7_CAEBR|nr:hypothetical protein L5515_017326 [Caenorhabditis briggsae]
MGTSIELGNSTSDFADDVLNVTEISAETMEKTHAVTTSRAMKHFHDLFHSSAIQNTVVKDTRREVSPLEERWSLGRLYCTQTTGLNDAEICPNLV